jgi:hypothetical protein
VLHPPEGYLQSVQRICRDRDVLFIADEVITGFGRLGEWFGSLRLGITLDLITCAKGITSGYVPLGAVVASVRVAEPFWTAGTEHVFRHGYMEAGTTVTFGPRRKGAPLGAPSAVTGADGYVATARRFPVGRGVRRSGRSFSITSTAASRTLPSSVSSSSKTSSAVDSSRPRRRAGCGSRGRPYY